MCPRRVIDDVISPRAYEFSACLVVDTKSENVYKLLTQTVAHQAYFLFYARLRDARLSR